MSSNARPVTSGSVSSNYTYQITIIGILFFVFGFVTWLNATLIPFLKTACELNYFQALFVAFATYIAYFFMAIPASWVLQKTGFKNGISLGLLVMALGALIFIPAATSRNYALFLTGLFVQGLGLAVLQTAANPYITILGPIESAAKRISIMGICNKVAGMLSPVILAALVLTGVDELNAHLETVTDIAERTSLLNELAGRVIKPYIVMAVVLAGLAMMIRFSNLPEVEAEDDDTADDSTKTVKTSIFQFPHLLLGALTLFMYVGVEVIAGDTIIAYGQSLGIETAKAKFFTSFTLGAMVAGYLIGTITIPRYLKQETALKICAVLGIFFALGAILTPAFHADSEASKFISVLFIALLGLANSLIWPAVWPLALKKLGRFTKIGSALLIMGIAGGAIMPLAYGGLADVINPQQAYWVLIPCYLFILFYSIKGHKIGLKDEQARI